MLKQKQAGKPIRKDAPRTQAPKGGNVIDLLKRSLEMEEEAKGEGFCIQNKNTR